MNLMELTNKEKLFHAKSNVFEKFEWARTYWGDKFFCFENFRKLKSSKMQLKMPRSRKEWLKFLRTENDYMTYLLEAFEVPETVEGKRKNAKFVNHF